MKTLYFDTNHIDQIGGGGLALYNLSVALQEIYDVHLAQAWNPQMAEFEFLREPCRPFKIGKPIEIDVFVASKYAEWVAPQGKKNVFYCLYPRHAWDMKGYDLVLTLSEYSRRAVYERWGRDARILIGGAFHPDYAPLFPKENSFISSSRFFMEGNPDTLDGHSKNQHLLIQAFQTLPGDCPWTLTLAGSVLGDGDRKYFEACRRLAGEDSRIRFIPMATKEQLRDLYGRAKVVLHAMGYGRKDPAETEHYGICVEKGLLSGCAAIVHNSGGAPELAHGHWKTPEQLAQLMKLATTWSTFDDREISDRNRRTWETFSHQVRAAFADL